MPRCIATGCQRLVHVGLDMCDEHYGDGERSPCCGAQIMAAALGDVDLRTMAEEELFGVCSRCGQIVYASGQQLPVEVMDEPT